MIDYEKLTIAIDHYKRLGYKYIDVPWIISLDSILVTRPKGTRLFSTFAGELVASGEQSFIEIKDKLEVGKKYQCITPCFRDEPVHDELHLQYFMKVELILIPKSSPELLIGEVIYDSMDFFSKFAKPIVLDAPIANAVDNRDILINNIEVGSYGYRSYEGFKWIYGTGCAEPRLSQALART